MESMRATHLIVLLGAVSLFVKVAQANLCNHREFVNNIDYIDELSRDDAIKEMIKQIKCLGRELNKINNELVERDSRTRSRFRRGGSSFRLFR